MKITLRKRKLPSGKINLSIEYYKGTLLQPNGKRKTVKDYENLKLFLHSEPKNASEVKENKKNLALAKEILANRINENEKNRVLATITTEGKFLSKEVVDLALEIKKIDEAKFANQSIKNKIEFLKSEIENLYLELDKNNKDIQEASHNILQQLIKGVASSKTQEVFKEYTKIFLK